MQANTYLQFDGNCEAAFKFYEENLGAKTLSLMRYEGSPAAAQVPPEWRNKILHARIALADTVLMASDAPPGRYSAAHGFSVALGVDKPQEAERIFDALKVGGKVGMPLEKTFFAERFGMLVDRFGIPWMILCEHAA
ncbi:MAG TPA: VOC family protein [Stellaceae bacterium]|nr:VOC family protein [Stellaceae bacterium]